MRRLSQGGESRLHDKLSIGVGGHINPEDLEEELSPAPTPTPAGRARDPVAAGTRREIAEELEIRGTYALRSVGILNDDTNPVGAVHVGLVQVLAVDGSVTIREREVLEGRLTSRDGLLSLLADGAPFESWSARLVERLDELLPEALPTLS